jgi:hypothetical protein
MRTEFKSERSLFAVAVTICFGVLLSSCGLPSEAERTRNENDKKVNWACADIRDQIGEMIDAGNDLITYDYSYGTYLQYKEKYESVQDELIIIDDELDGPTLILKQVVRDVFEIASNPDSVITSIALKVSTNREKWNNRISKMESIQSVLDVLCYDDRTRIDGIEYSADSKCDLSCHFSVKSKVEGILVPDDSIAKEDKFGFFEYATVVGSVDEISKYYLSTLGSRGWKIQPSESNFGPKSDGGFLVAQVWCRSKPKTVNLLIVLSSLAKQPGTTYISLGTDGDKSLKCE